MARHETSTPPDRRPDPRLACGIQPRQSGLQGTGLVVECEPLGYACSRGPSAGDARARVDAYVTQSSLDTMVRGYAYTRVETDDRTFH